MSKLVTPANQQALQKGFALHEFESSSTQNIRGQEMTNLTQLAINACVESLKIGYCQLYGTPLGLDDSPKSDYIEIVAAVANLALSEIAGSDALYHDVEHTILVTLVGQEILRGKHQCEGNVSQEDWLHALIALLCHDVGYVKGVCQQDETQTRCFATATPQGMVQLPPGATDASLTPYHVDRSKQFVIERLIECPWLDLQRLQAYIELTRFPVPAGEAHQDTENYPGLIRAADLIGQLADPRYLQKLPALFHEFEENGTNRCLGYHHPGELRAGYPNFFKKVVCPYIQPALQYLNQTAGGRQIVEQLYRNVAVVEQELQMGTDLLKEQPAPANRPNGGEFDKGDWLQLLYSGQTIRLRQTCH